jgi:hypothetical protein
MAYKLGLLARADNTGLGYQTYDYYKFLKPHKTCVIDLSPINGNPQNDWYPNAQIYRDIPNHQQVIEILNDIDVLLTAETPYNLDLYRLARERGVKTICVENPEFYDHEMYPQYEMPDLIILPSVWQIDYIRNHAESRGTKVIQLHHPVDTTEIEFVPRNIPIPFHIAGKPATNDRNGTWDFMQAVPDGTVITQSEDLAYHIRRQYRFSTVYTNIQDNNQLYQYGNLLVFPRKYGGNCLPLNEALASGVPVIMPNISPNNHLLPAEWLVNAQHEGYFEPRMRVDYYKSNVDSILDRINWFKSVNFEEQSRRAREIAETISWNALLPKYIEAIESIV